MKKNKNTYILAEMASSHEGNREIAGFIIESAVKAKADGILFQLSDLESYIIPDDPDYQEVKNIYMSQEIWDGLIKKANSLGIDAWANVYDLKSAEFAKTKKIKGFKLHSSNLENEDLVHKISQFKKEIHLSIGGVEKKEIAKTLKLIYSVNKKAKIHLMYGLQNFPTRPEGVNLNFVKDLSEKFKIPWGYQDHSEPTSSASTFLPALAVSQGASIIEKHITQDRSLKGRDYQAALNPDEFAGFVGDIRIVDSILSKRPVEFSLDELKYREYKTLMKVLANKDIETGEKFNKKNIVVMRAKSGEIRGMNLKLLLNKKAKFSYKKYECIKKAEI